MSRSASSAIFLASWALISSGFAQAPRAGGGFPEGEAAITDLLVHFSPGLHRELYPSYRDLFRVLHEDVRIWVAVAEEEHLDAARYMLDSIGVEEGRRRFVVTGPGLSVWARDRMLVLRRGAGSSFLAPSPQDLEEASSGDLLMGRALSGQLERSIAVKSDLRFEGGNILFDGNRVLVGHNVVWANTSQSRPEEENDLRHRLEAQLGRLPIVVGGGTLVPHHHLDMYLTVVGERTLLLGDPELGASYLRELKRRHLEEWSLPEFEDWTVEANVSVAPLYEAIRRELEADGYRVPRIPILHGDGGAVLTWNNAVLELRDGVRRAYVPAYEIPELDDRAAEIYRSVGCRVFPIDVSRIIRRGGAVRCLTNVLRWSDAGPGMRSKNQ